MKAYTAYVRGDESTFIFNYCQCIIKYGTCLEFGQCAHICRSVIQFSDVVAKTP